MISKCSGVSSSTVQTNQSAGVCSLVRLPMLHVDLLLLFWQSGPQSGVEIRNEKKPRPVLNGCQMGKESLLLDPSSLVFELDDLLFGCCIFHNRYSMIWAPYETCHVKAEDIENIQILDFKSNAKYNLSSLI